MNNRAAVTFIAIAGVVGMHCAWSAASPPANLTPEERTELNSLVERFRFPLPEGATTLVERQTLNSLRSYLTEFATVTERLVVCETPGGTHLEKDDVIYLTRVGYSSNLKMRVVRHEGQADESNPWTSTSGNPEIIINPSVTFKAESGDPPGKFSPKGVGSASVPMHVGGSLHDFSIRRDTKETISIDCDAAPGDDVLMIIVPDHEYGDRHGGHAVAN